MWSHHAKGKGGGGGTKFYAQNMGLILNMVAMLTNAQKSSPEPVG